MSMLIISLRLVLACRFHPEPLLMALLGFLAPSRPVVVYCHLLEVMWLSSIFPVHFTDWCAAQPLIECYKSLKTSEEVVFDVQISETWTRYYQVYTAVVNINGVGCVHFQCQCISVLLCSQHVCVLYTMYRCYQRGLILPHLWTAMADIYWLQLLSKNCSRIYVFSHVYMH